mmetsp:Transcript_22824/g.63776  ORF Transcript_22824/g.63776 Transcript_22824/m.63776 type:complete len:93 (-) Transcript_22824:1129-1407(-)
MRMGCRNDGSLECCNDGSQGCCNGGSLLYRTDNSLPSPQARLDRSPLPAAMRARRQTKALEAQRHHPYTASALARRIVGEHVAMSASWQSME